MNAEDIITVNECRNDTGTVHLYYNKTLDVWVAYGYSAYALRLCIKSRGKNCLRSYSAEMAMPMTFVDNLTVNDLRKFVEEGEVQEAYIKFINLKPFSTDDYERWTRKLRQESTIDADMNTDTPVSAKVSKNEFIKDGMTGMERNIKRIGDFLMSTVALAVFSPLIVVCWAAVRLEDGGPAIYKQERIGRFGRPFNIYKFRSMRVDAEKAGPQLSKSGGDGDERLTKIGRFLRAHHLDELPQLWNVFCGEMAFIGPRPERKFYIDQILEYDKRYEYLYQIRPGVTSYATLYNGYTDTMEKMLRRLEYDLYYLGHRSWWFDFKILVNTFLMIVAGKKF